ncbi:MAG TPA: hypothetical protein VK395_25655 [Gemmataceae bacterium]|nr:hypothetical protein [Gemmataceae bacterium]
MSIGTTGRIHKIKSREALDDLGTLLFTFLIDWANLTFFQFLLILGSNVLPALRHSKNVPGFRDLRYHDAAERPRLCSSRHPSSLVADCPGTAHSPSRIPQGK